MAAKEHRGPTVTKLKVSVNRTVHLGKYESAFFSNAVEADPDPTLTNGEQLSMLLNFLLEQVNEIAESETVKALVNPE